MWDDGYSKGSECDTQRNARLFTYLFREGFSNSYSSLGFLKNKKFLVSFLVGEDVLYETLILTDSNATNFSFKVNSNLFSWILNIIIKFYSRNIPLFLKDIIQLDVLREFKGCPLRSSITISNLTPANHLFLHILNSIRYFCWEAYSFNPKNKT